MNADGRGSFPGHDTLRSPRSCPYEVVNSTPSNVEFHGLAGVVLNIRAWDKKVGKELKTDTEKSIPIGVHPWLAF
jgi:hypothetical protein